MAVSISQFPADYTFSDNPLTFVFSSTQTAQANFSFIVETYFNAALVSVDRVFPEVSGYAHIDVSPIVKNLLNKPVINNSIYSESGISADINIKVIENYGTPPVDQADLTSATIPVIKGCLSDMAWTTYTAPDYMVASVGAQFMTEMNSLKGIPVWAILQDPFVWINQFGSWDSFIFRHNVERKGEVTERTYTKKFGAWDGTTFTYDLNNAGNIRVGTQQTDKLTIYTDWITQAEQNYLTTLYKAPRYFLYYAGYIYNVRVTSNQFTFKKARFEEEISEAVELDIVNNHNGLSL